MIIYIAKLDLDLILISVLKLLSFIFLQLQKELLESSIINLYSIYNYSSSDSIL